MNPFNLRYGDYSWPELDSFLKVEPFFLHGRQQISIIQALRQNVVVKTDKLSGYSTRATHFRFLITGKAHGETIKPINIVGSFVKKTSPSNMIHIPLYPQQINDIGGETGYFFAADNVSLCSSMKAVETIYGSLIGSMETITPESVAEGQTLCNLLKTHTQKSRFSTF